MEGNISAEVLEDWIRKVSTEFYELVYEDEWLKEVFKVVEKKVITDQQVDFMLQCLGGPKRYGGRNPGDAHVHIFINEEMWVLRENYLVEAFKTTKCPEWLSDKWLKIDSAFKSKIVMKSAAEVQKRFTMDELVIVHKPKTAA